MFLGLPSFSGESKKRKADNEDDDKENENENSDKQPIKKPRSETLDGKDDKMSLIFKLEYHHLLVICNNGAPHVDMLGYSAASHSGVATVTDMIDSDTDDTVDEVRPKPMIYVANFQDSTVSRLPEGIDLKHPSMVKYEHPIVKQFVMGPRGYLRDMKQTITVGPDCFADLDDGWSLKYHQMIQCFFPDKSCRLDFLCFLRSLFVSPWLRLPNRNKILMLRAPITKVLGQTRRINAILQALTNLCCHCFDTHDRYLAIKNATMLRDFHAISIQEERSDFCDDLPIVHTTNAQARSNLDNLITKIQTSVNCTNTHQDLEWKCVWDMKYGETELFYWIFGIIKRLRALEDAMLSLLRAAMDRSTNGAIYNDTASIVLLYYDTYDLQEFARIELVTNW